MHGYLNSLKDISKTTVSNYNFKENCKTIVYDCSF